MPFSLQKFATDLPDSCQDLWIADQSRFAMLRSPYLLTWRHIDIRLGYAESGGIDALTYNPPRRTPYNTWLINTVSLLKKYKDALTPMIFWL